MLLSTAELTGFDRPAEGSNATSIAAEMGGRLSIISYYSSLNVIHCNSSHSIHLHTSYHPQLLCHRRPVRSFVWLHPNLWLFIARLFIQVIPQNPSPHPTASLVPRPLLSSATSALSCRPPALSCELLQRSARPLHSCVTPTAPFHSPPLFPLPSSLASLVIPVHPSAVLRDARSPTTPSLCLGIVLTPPPCALLSFPLSFSVSFLPSSFPPSLPSSLRPPLQNVEGGRYREGCAGTGLRRRTRTALQEGQPSPPLSPHHSTLLPLSLHCVPHSQRLPLSLFCPRLLSLCPRPFSPPLRLRS